MGSHGARMAGQPARDLDGAATPQKNMPGKPQLFCGRSLKGHLRKQPLSPQDGVSQRFAEVRAQPGFSRREFRLDKLAGTGYCLPSRAARNL